MGSAIGSGTGLTGDYLLDGTISSGSPTLTTLVDFDNNDGDGSQGVLIADADGDLFGTTNYGGADNVGEVFELANTGTGYASTPALLTSFSYATGYIPRAGLIADAAGDLFGTTSTGGANSEGTVFEIANTATGYASTPTMVATFNGANGGGPNAGLVANAAGDLFGTTEGGGTTSYGTVFEIAFANGSYASTPTTLVSFNSTNGAYPYAGLVADAAGDLFGTTVGGGTDNDGTVFEIACNNGTYASTATTLVTFNSADGQDPYAGLIADTAGDLFGTTQGGGANGDGTVFEIVKTNGTYASTPTTLATFNGSDGAYPKNGLIFDAAGDLFGTTQAGGASNLGTVFEIANNGGSYASTPITVFSFNGIDGAAPNGLIANAAGDLFGTTADDGPNADGTLFELSNSGYQVASRAWLDDASGNYDDPTRWTDGVVPIASNDVIIDFADDPQVLHSSGEDAVNSLTNTAGDFVMSGGTLTANTLENDSLMSWTGGSLILDAGTGDTATLLNTAAAALAITPNGQRLTTTGIGTSSLTNAGSITVTGALGTANIDAALVNTGNVVVTLGTLSLNGGGSSNAFDLATAASGVLQFGAPESQTSGPTFTLTGGIYGGVETIISGSTLNATAASAVYFNDLRLTASGALILGATAAQTNAAFIQGGTAWANASGTPFLSGSATFTVYGGAALTAGTESGSGLTRLFGTGSIGVALDVDGGRTIENDGFLTWSSGSITLGAGDPTALTQSGTLSNVAGAILYVTATGGRLAIGSGGTGVLANAGVAAFYAGPGEVDIDAAVANTGYLQALSGTLSLNGGGSSDAGHLIVAAGATLQFGAAAGTTGGATFTLTGGGLTAGNVVISGSTVNAAAASGVSMGALTLAGSGALLLGAVNGQASSGFSQGPGVWENASGTPFLSGSGNFTVFGGASLAGGVESGSGLTRLYGTSVIGGAGVSLDGGRTLENDGWLNWSSGAITLGAGDAAALVQAGTLTNVAGATLFVTASGGRIADAAGGVVQNAGVMAVYAGGGEVDVDAAFDNTGYVQALSGTLSLNGGGSSNAGGLIEGAGAVLQFGTAASGVGGTFTVTGGFYDAAVTVVTGGELDLAAASGAAFGTSVAVSGSGVLGLGSLFVDVNVLDAGSGGQVDSNGIVVVNGPAVLASTVLSGSGTMVLEGGGSIGGALLLNSGLTLQNSGTLDWTGGSITLGSGTAAAAGVLHNAGGAVLDIETNGTISSPDGGTVFNAGTILADGFGSTVVETGMSNSGTVAVSAGTLSFAQAVSGSGAFVLDGVATLDLDGGTGSGSTMQFVYPGGTLETQALGGFGAVISGFAAGDVIDAAGVGFVTGTTTVGFNGGTLTVTEGASSAGFTLSGSYVAGGFQIGTDGHGGTDITT